MLARLVVQRLMVHMSAGWLVLGWLGAANVINLVRECSDSSGKQHLPLSSVSRGGPSTRKSNGRFELWRQKLLPVLPCHPNKVE